MLDKYSRGLGVQKTVGDVISMLFPAGFLVDVYHARATFKDDLLLNKEYRYDSEKSKFILSVLSTREETFRRVVDKGVAEIWPIVNLSSSAKEWKSGSFLNENGRASSKKKQLFLDKYSAPPYSPFDLFAICGILLRDSGAYHHIESEFIGADEDNETTCGRVILSTAAERNLLNDIGDVWRDHDFAIYARTQEVDQSEYEDEHQEPISILNCWIEILAAWNLPIFQPIAESEQPPAWWKYAYRLLCISDRAARDSGVAEQDDSMLSSHGGIPRGGFWASHAADILAASDRIFEEKFAEFCDELEIANCSLIDWGSGNVNTLSAANRDAVCILPKLRTSQSGCTIRALSHSLALLPARGFIRASWISQNQGYFNMDAVKKKPFNLVIVPFPYDISAQQFAPVSRVASDQRAGKFRFEPDQSSDVSAVLNCIIKKAREQIGTVHGIVFPELALSSYQFGQVFNYVREFTNVELLCAGVNQRVPIDLLGNAFSINEDWQTRSDQAPMNDLTHKSTNEAIMATFQRLDRSEYPNSSLAVKRNFQATSHQKHHRWCLNESQILGYGLSSSLDPSINWWEDLSIHNRKLPFCLMRDKWAVATLICEDLARIDPAQQLVRAVGPNLIFSLVMDGPQRDDRWSARYATVLADDPGSAVITINSAGLIKRTLDVRKTRGHKDDLDNLMIALWRDSTSGSVPIVMPKNDSAVCLTLYEEATDEFTMDGRRNHYNSVSLKLGNQFSINCNR